jgi:hypothetical protein
MVEADRREEAGGSEVTTPTASSAKIVKKSVGYLKRADVWDRLYRLNQFVATLKQPRSTDDGYPVRKIVGQPRPRRR